eukprot:1871390-Pyramimonas_sp.AAC.1
MEAAARKPANVAATSAVGGEGLFEFTAFSVDALPLAGEVWGSRRGRWAARGNHSRTGGGRQPRGTLPAPHTPPPARNADPDS